MKVVVAGSTGLAGSTTAKTLAATNNQIVGPNGAVIIMVDGATFCEFG